MQKRMIFSILFLLLAGCGGGKLSNQDLIQRAEQDLNNKDFTGAITALSSVSPPSEQSTSLMSEANAGLGGFRLFQLYDQVVNFSTIEPQFLILFKLAFTYDSTALQNIKQSLSLIDSFLPNFNQRSDDTNTKYAFISFYNASQILLHDSDLHMQGSYASDWNPCLESQFPTLDIKQIIIDLDRGIKSLQQVAINNNQNDLQSLFNIIQKIQTESSINSFLYDQNSVVTDDVISLRNYINQILYGNPACNIVI